MYYPRNIEKEILKFIDDPEIIVLTGMRRVGKTTLYRHIFDNLTTKNKIFLDLDDPLRQRIFEEKSFDAIYLNLKSLGLSEKERAYVFLDEIQSQPEAVKAIKYLYDHYHIKFFLTGSSSFYLKNLFPESLSGRKFIFEIFPLDFSEFLTFKEKPKDIPLSFQEKEKQKNIVLYESYRKYFEEYVLYGGFPQVVLEKNTEKKKLRIEDIFRSYFDKDVKSLASFHEIKGFRDLLLLLIPRIGNRLDVTKLSKELSLSRATLYSYITFLEQTYFITLLPSYTKNVDREVSKLKKLYLCDNGFAKVFGNLSFGSLLENAVYLNLKKYGNIRYYQKHSGTEIDFILPEKKTALEVKETANQNDVNRLKKIARPLGMNHSYAISWNFNESANIIPACDV